MTRAPAPQEIPGNDITRLPYREQLHQPIKTSTATFAQLHPWTRKTLSTGCLVFPPVSVQVQFLNRTLCTFIYSSSPHITMAFALFSPSPTILRLGLGLGIGLSAASLHPQSPFRAAPLRCDWAPSGSGSGSRSTGPEINFPGRASEPSIATQAKNTLLTPENMRQVSMGSVLGLIAGVGLRAFSKVLVVVLGMGVVLVEVCGDFSLSLPPFSSLLGSLLSITSRSICNLDTLALEKRKRKRKKDANGSFDED